MFNNQRTTSFSTPQNWNLGRRESSHYHLISPCCKLIASCYSSLYSDTLKDRHIPTEQSLDKASERVAYKLNTTLPAGSKASLKIPFKGELTSSLMGYYRSAYEEDGKAKYYALTQFAVCGTYYSGGLAWQLRRFNSLLRLVELFLAGTNLYSKLPLPSL